MFLRDIVLRVGNFFVRNISRKLPKDFPSELQCPCCDRIFETRKLEIEIDKMPEEHKQKFWDKEQLIAPEIRYTVVCPYCAKRIHLFKPLN